MSALSLPVTDTVTGARPAAFESFAEVALPVPIARTFSYGVPAALLRARPGCRARVRFGSRLLVGCILEIRDERPNLPEATRLMPLGALLDDEPVLSPSQIELARWIADYYIAAPGLACRAMLPPETPREQRLMYARVDTVDPSAVPGFSRDSLAAKVLDALSRPMTASAVARSLDKKSVTGTLATLLRKGLVERRTRSGASPGARTVRVCRITEEGSRALAEEKLHPTTTRVLTLLSVATDWVPLSAIRYELDLQKGGPFRGLESRGQIEIRAEENPPDTVGASSRTKAGAFRDAHGVAGESSRRDRGRARRRPVSSRRSPWSDGKRKDRGLPARRSKGTRPGPKRSDARSRDRAHPQARRSSPRPFR